jgi:hypothetical protein
LRSSAICSLVRAYFASAEARPAVAKNAPLVSPAWTKSCGAGSWYRYCSDCSPSTASAAAAAWKYASRPRVMSPAAASDTSRITPSPERTPPLAYMSITTATMSTKTPTVTWIVRLGSRRRAGTKSAAAAATYTTSVGITRRGDCTPRLK